MTVVFDGWPLARAPGSPPALHLLELLARLPRGVKALLALPSPLEGPAPAPVMIIPSGESNRARLAWEQVTLPRLALRRGATVLHLTHTSAPLFSPIPVILSPAEPVSRGILLPPSHTRAAGSRLRAALGRGGLSAARALLWPADLPAPTLSGAVLKCLPPVVHPDLCFEPAPIQAEDSGYVAAFGPFADDAALSALVETWRWAAPAMGEGWSVRLAGCPAADVAKLAALRAAARLPGDLLPAPFSGLQSLAALLSGAGAVLHMGALCPWGDSLLQSLAASRPVAAEEIWGVDARVGPAAYLAEPGDRRALGAALLTLLVDENVAEQLSQAAHDRAAGWSHSEFSEQLGEVYRGLQRRMNST